jgi:hypothetical protein
MTNNGLIAKFMGGVFDESLPFTYIKSGWVNTPANDGQQIAQEYDFKYHKSWDWLIPVGQKMNQIAFDGNWGLFEQFFSDLFYNAEKKEIAENISKFFVEVFNENYKSLTKQDVPDYLSAAVNHVLEMNILSQF